MKKSADFNKATDLVALVSAVCITLFGLSTIFGWLFNIAALKGALAAGIDVKANTAICFLLAGSSLLLQLPHKSSERKIIFGRLIAAVLFLFGASLLSQHIFGWNLGIDQLFFQESAGKVATSSPNRTGPPASLNFMLAGIALFLLNYNSAKHKDFVSPIAVAIGVIALLPVLGYLFGARQLFGIANFTGIALSTALVFLILSVSLVCSFTEGSIRRLLCSEDAGGVLSRRLMPPALLLPPLLGFIRTAGEQMQFIDATFGRSLLILAFILIFARLVWASALVLQATDRKLLQLIESERAARSNAERANRFKDEFLATLSHELRTPLNAILGWSQLLKRNNSLTADVRKGVETIERNSRLQAQMIEDLLDMSRIISGKLRLNIKQTELPFIISEAVQTIEPLANAKEIKIEKKLPENACSIDGDPARLQQVLLNLLSNAVKFTPKGGEILISLNFDENYAKISVSDTGQGIEKQNLTQIFERFTQADNSITRRNGGLGIGLSVVRELINAHQGTVHAQSDGLGLGATFAISIPLKAKSFEESGEEVASPEQSADTQKIISFQGLKVLVVDDDVDAREVAGRILQQHNAEVIFAGSAAEAMEKVIREHPDVLVSDIGMPDQDGYQLIENIRGLTKEQGRDIPAVALTAFIREDDKKNALSHGYQMHLAKPVDAYKLIYAVNKLAP